MILIGLGANMPSAAGPPPAGLHAVEAYLCARQIHVVKRSGLYRSPPMQKHALRHQPAQPLFYNAVWQVRSCLGARALLQCLHDIELVFGRKRTAQLLGPWQARPLDLDLLDWHGRVQTHAPVLPHPRLHQRGFVLAPLCEIAPHWRHPVSGWHARSLYARLPAIARPCYIGQTYA